MKPTREPVLLSRISYRQVLQGLEHYRKQHEEDRRENPNSIPPSWGIPLRYMIEDVVRSNREYCGKNLPDAVLEYLVRQNKLVRYAGCYTFPSHEVLPSKHEIAEMTLRTLERTK